MMGSWLTKTMAVVVVLFQTTVPVAAIYQREMVLRHGEFFYFEAAPVDPYDPFSGKYVALGFKNNQVEVENPDKWKYQQKGFVPVQKDANGVVILGKMAAMKPMAGEFIPVKFTYYQPELKKAVVEFPFDRFYMDEFKAPKAERVYREQTQEKRNVYVAVRIWKGKPVIEDLFVDGKPIREYLKGRV